MYRGAFAALPRGGSDFLRVHSVNLDEYVGLAPTHEQSYRYFMDSNLFDHINIDKANTYVAKGTGNAEENLREFNAVLDRTDIDVQVLGVGPTVISASTSRATRSATAPTRRCSTRAPSTPTSASSPRATMCRATRSPWAWATSCARKKLLMIVSGHEEDAMRRLLLSERIDPHCPATFLRLHRDAVVLLERSPRRRDRLQGVSLSSTAPLRIPRRGRPVSRLLWRIFFMCGIVGFTGSQAAAPLLLDGLRKLEYRGYDSAGIAVQKDGALHMIKASGHIDALAEKNAKRRAAARHFRHRPPAGDARRAHRHERAPAYVRRRQIGHRPQRHYRKLRGLRDELESKGFVFRSETDTEVIVHLLDMYYTGDLKAAVLHTAARLEGSMRSAFSAPTSRGRSAP